MPTACRVCAHPLRSEIDKRLAMQVVNVRQLAREYGIGKDSMARHREKHLPGFLAALQARAQVLDLDQLQAEYQRLYLTALDALAQAEYGTLVRLDDDGTEHRAISSTAVARLLREARAGLDSMARLAVAGAGAGGSSPTASTNPALDDAIAAALERVASRSQLSAGVVDAEVVEGDASAEGGAAGTAAPGSTAEAPPDLVRADGGVPRALTVPLESAEPRGGSQDADQPVTGTAEQGTPADDVPDYEQLTREWIRSEAAKRGDVLPQHASREEMKAMGYDVDAARKIVEAKGER